MLKMRWLSPHQRSASKLATPSVAPCLSLTDGRFQDTSAVTVYVGEKRTQFLAHRELLCEVSGYFKAALTGQFAEASKNEITLGDYSADTFDAFLQWLYSKSLDLADHSGQFVTGSATIKWTTAIDLYVFAAYIQCPKLGDEVLECIWRMVRGPRWSSSLPSHDAVNAIYGSTPEYCELRRLIIALFVWKRDTGVWKDCRSSKDWITGFSMNFCHDLLIATTRQAMMQDKDPFSAGTSDPNPFQDEGQGQKSGNWTDSEENLLDYRE
jgi:BTB/POZ domain